MATDEVVESLWYVSQLLGEEERGLRELELLLPGATEPYVGAAAFRRPTGPGGEAVPVTRDRVSCCMFYTLRPAEICATCPRACAAGRTAERTTAVVAQAC
jgi:ferric iron reductase protein FhuF